MSNLSEDELELVISHGTGSLERSLGLVLLAKRRQKITELRSVIEAIDGEESTEEVGG